MFLLALVSASESSSKFCAVKVVGPPSFIFRLPQNMCGCPRPLGYYLISMLCYCNVLCLIAVEMSEVDFRLPKNICGCPRPLVYLISMLLLYCFRPHSYRDTLGRF